MHARVLPNLITPAIDWLEVELFFDLTKAHRAVAAHLVGEATGRATADVRKVKWLKELVPTTKFAVRRLPRAFQGRSVRYFTFRNLLLAARRDGSPRGGTGSLRTNLFFRATGKACLRADVREELSILRDLLSSSGGEPLGSSVHRLDLCVDVTGVDIEWFFERLENGKVVGRFRTHETFYAPREMNNRRRRTGWRCCGDGLKFTVYDKIAQSKLNPETRPALVETRWGGREPGRAIRIEFKLLGRRLRRDGIIIYDDVDRHWKTLLSRYLQKWIRVMDTTRVLDRVWNRIVLQTSKQAFSPFPLSASTSEAMIAAEVTSLTQQLVGVGVSIAFRKRIQIVNPDEFATFVLDLVRNYASEHHGQLERKLRKTIFEEP